MTARDFAFWLQGVFEVGKPTQLDAEQTELIRRHLALVFVHEIDPSMGGAAQQAKLNEVHAGTPVVDPTTTGTKPAWMHSHNPNGLIMRC